MNRIKMKRGAVKCLTLLPLIGYLLFCVSCSNMLQPSKKIAKLQPGYGRVAVSIAGTSARTVFPEAAFEKYEYEFVKVTDDTREAPEPQEPEDGMFTLALGEWQVTVKAYAQAGDAEPIASGTSATFEVTKAGTKQVFVQLVVNSAPGSTGNFTYNIKYPKDAEIIAFTLENLLDDTASAITLTPVTGKVDDEDDDALIAEGGKANVPVGLYWLTVKLELDETATGANEVVYVYDGLTSEYSAVFMAANFVMPLFTVTFDVDGGSPTPAPQVVPKGGKAAKPADPVLEDFDFEYWYNTADFAEWNFNVDTVTANITLKASWKPEGATVKYDVTYDPDNEGEIITRQVWEGAKAPELQAPTKSGYRFDGWYTDGTKWNFDTPVSGDLDLKAKWIKVLNVSFDSNGGSTVPSQTVDEDGKVIKPDNPTKNVDIFDGWYKEPDLTNEWDFDTDPVTEDITLYAKWDPRYAVTFNANGGSAVSTQIIVPGEKASKPTDPTRTSYNFDGWYKESNFTTQWDFDTDIVNSNVTLYAKWIPIYTVTFNGNGGTPVPSNQTVIEGSTATAPTTNLTRTGTFTLTAGLWAGQLPSSGTAYVFAGWRKQGENINFDFNTPITNHTTLIAAWSPSSIDLSSTEGNNIVEKAVNYVKSDSSGTTEYTLVLDANVNNVGAQYDKKDVTLTITSLGNSESDRVVITRGNNAPIFHLINGSLVIDGYVTLQGTNDGLSAESCGVRLDSNSNSNDNKKLELKGHTKITGHRGSGVYGDCNKFTITMSGYAEISGNSGTSGGGVFLDRDDNTLTMSENAKIVNNTASALGGGVMLGGYYNTTDITFTMNGGEISGNTANKGGGVYIQSTVRAQFIVASDAVKANIKNNTLTGSNPAGAQVYKEANGVFTVNGVAQGTAGTAQGWDSWN